MNLIRKLTKELEELWLLTMYFAVWLGIILFLKWLVLEQYNIKVRGASLALVGALVVAKVVLVLEHISLGQWVRRRPVAVDVALRTLLYTLGVHLLLLLEKALEARHEAGGLGKALVEVFHNRDIHQVLAETIFVGGSLLGFNVLSAFKRYFGGAELRRLFLATSLQDLQRKETAREGLAKAKETVTNQ